MSENHEENKCTGHDGKPWPHTMDANAWATEFCKRNSASDHAMMLGWFANAIMCGYDTANQQKVMPLDGLTDDARIALLRINT
jgi:hypothetical protein